MSNHPSEKYRLFRNYMTNDLGVTRQDIEAWTKQAVSTEVSKLVEQINVEGLAQDAIDKWGRNAIEGITGSYGRNSSLRKAIVEKLAEDLDITVSVSQNSQD